MSDKYIGKSLVGVCTDNIGVDDGRRAGDKSHHKGDWGTHSGADYLAEQVSVTPEQQKKFEKLLKDNWP